jgi:transcriptional regulator with XRE-family HTH domain
MVIGKHLRELREKQGLLLRQVAASLEVDTAYISKMERGEKNIKREFIVKLAEIYNVNIDNLLAIWLADQIFDLIKYEDVALKALSIAENEVKTFIGVKKMKKK